MAVLRGFRHLPRTLSEWGSFFAKSKIESDLGNPGTSGHVLSSTTAGVRTWIDKDDEVMAPTTFRCKNWTTAQLVNAAHVVNTENKRAGTMVWNTTTGLPMFSDGNGTTDPWQDAVRNGANTITPV